MTLCAQSIGLPLERFLSRGIDSQVIARYDSTLQLESREGALWAITARSNAGAMCVVVLTVPEWCDGATVRVRDGKIVSGDVELDWDTSARFDPYPHARALNATQCRRAVQAFAGALSRWQLPDSLGFWDALSEMWEPMSHALREGDEDALNALISRLIGRGTGLTPTGDDFLQALLVTLATGNEADRAAFQPLGRAVLPHLSRTTRVSRAFLCEAMQGWAFGALKDVLDDLPVVTQDKMNALLEIGATSGPAYMFGILMGLDWKN